jgi:hypothetical protein
MQSGLSINIDGALISRAEQRARSHTNGARERRPGRLMGKSVSVQLAVVEPLRAVAVSDTRE